MKSIKKRFKLLLAELHEAAYDLALLSSDLSLLAEIQQTAHHILTAVATLNEQTVALKKEQFREHIAESRAFAELEEIIDIDLISRLEEQFFKVETNQDNSQIGQFLQQLLDKIDRRFTKITTLIQQLTALCAGE
jgi:hypothetical protein